MAVVENSGPRLIELMQKSRQCWRLGVRKPGFKSWLCCDFFQGGCTLGWFSYSSGSKCPGNLPRVQLGLALENEERTTGNVVDSGTKLPENNSHFCYLPAGCDLRQVS